MKQKIQTLLDQLNHGLVEREDTLKTALLTVLAGENLVLVGPPGTAKSLIAQRIAKSLAHSSDKKGDNDYFEYLLTKFSTPEEIFGPLSITELKADRFKRNTTGYLPTVKMAFLDEIFKASSSILNALLTILNERIYHNGAERQPVLMQALIAASNELPTDQEELYALYDRFLVRSFVDYVSQDNLSRLFDEPGAMPKLSQLTATDLADIKCAAESVTLPPDVVEAIQRIWLLHKETFKEDRRESLSDRRLMKVIKLLRVSAATNGRSQVNLSDVFLLKDCLWNHQENAIQVRGLILKTLRSFSRRVPKNENVELSGIENEVHTYEVHTYDGVTGKAPSAPAQASAKLNSVVSGFKGSGTKEDPLLIQTVEELMDLSRPDVGLKGYYFRQTADIDCSALSSWTKILFKGHYDGGGHTIRHKKNGNGWLQLFNKIQAQSSVTNLILKVLRLADTVNESRIAHCLSTIDLVKGQATNCTITACQASENLIRGSATGCTITACQAVESLIRGSATGCTITACKSGLFLIFDTAAGCHITNCLVVINLNWDTTNNYANLGGIASTLSQNSVVEWCFVAGRLLNKGNGDVKFSGIANHCNESTVRQCALGRLKLSGSFVQLKSRIVETSLGVLKLENNASIDCNPGRDDIDGYNGKTVAAPLFKQRYFEHTLGWDFDTVWRWDDANDRPALRSVGMGATSQQAKPAGKDNNMTDLLTQQISANIWL